MGIDGCQKGKKKRHVVGRIGGKGARCASPACPGKDPRMR